AAYTAGISFEAGSDTTRATTHAFIKAMMLHPRVQQKAIEELHAVVGSGKLPAGEHIPQLKYISAIVKETLRWFPVAINGFPHATPKEDRYENFRIPKGASIITAIWAANYDEQCFTDPREFRPERHKDSSIHQSATATNTEDCGFYSFGAGRRMCPGIHLAANAMTIFFARILWAFEILPEIDVNGDPLPVDRDATVEIG
ncbi:cytochrome P450, partial [Ralstonia pseudosolanacearum]|uniref:cytochrome P450 n=1 Tax=Ralstonia pseudosolanacearum TaxID=1310165 RepID=UPI003CE758B0